MKIEIAEKAGFCFGVARAVKMAYDVANTPGRHACYGMLIHNNDVTEDLKRRGVDVVTDLSKVAPDTDLMIRAHGIAKAEQEYIISHKIPMTDATCPYVKKIHRIAETSYHSGRQVIICGDAAHPEVKGINGWCGNAALILGSEEEIDNIYPIGSHPYWWSCH